MMFDKIALHLLIIKAIYCEDNVSEKFITQTNNSATTECMTSVIRKFFPCGTLITIVDSEVEDEFVKFLRGDNDCYSFIIRTFDDQDWYIPTPVYVIRADNITEFSEGVPTVTNDLFWNPRGRFIIELEILEEDEMNIVFDILIEHKAYDAILIRYSNNDLVIDTYYPFKDNNCGKKWQMATIATCNNVAHLEWVRNEKYSLSNCTVVVAATQNIPNFIYKSSNYMNNGKYLPGLEQLLLEAMAERENLRLSYILEQGEHNYGVVLKNHTATGLLRLLQNKEADIAAGGFILIQNRIDLFDFFYGYNYAAFNVLTPSVGEEIWKDIYKVFSRETWMLMLIAFCLVAVISTMKQRLFLKRNQNLINVTLKLWGYFFLNTSSKLSRDKRFKTVMLFWIWFTFFISNFFNSELYSLLTSRTPIKRDIKVDQLRELPYEPCISRSTRTYYRYAYNEELPKGRRNPACRFTDTALDYVATQKISYAIDLDYIFNLHKHKYENENGVSKLETWSLSINNVIAMYFVRGFPLRDEFQYYALRMFESGVLSKNLDQIYRVNNSHPHGRLHKYHYEKMWLADLRIHFYIFWFGSVLSVICFVLEIVWHRHSNALKAKWGEYLRPNITFTH